MTWGQYAGAVSGSLSNNKLRGGEERTTWDDAVSGEVTFEMPPEE